MFVERISSVSHLTKFFVIFASQPTLKGKKREDLEK